MKITFQTEFKLVQTLVNLLEREQKTLVNHDIADIEILMDEKAQVLQKINAASQLRYRALQAESFSPDEAGMNTFIRVSVDEEMNAAWLNFQRELTVAKELNRVNGVLISRHFNRNRDRLNDLQGNHSSSTIYGANGQHATSNFSSNSLAV